MLIWVYIVNLKQTTHLVDQLVALASIILCGFKTESEKAVPHGCPVNDARDENRMAMHEIVELFANNQQLWIDEFLTVFEKMQENGYGSESLTCAWKYDAKNQWPIPC